MAVRSITKRKLRKSRIGDMRTRIELCERSLTAPNFNTASVTEKYSVLTKTWAEVITLDGYRSFDGIPMVDRPTHLFIIRFRENVTSETRIRYNKELYRILKLQDPEERGMYLYIYAKPDGDEDKEAAQ